MTIEKTLPRETVHLCCALTGKEREFFWRDSFSEFDFFDLKGVLEGLFGDDSICPSRSQGARNPFLMRTTAADRPYRRQESRLDRRASGARVLDAYDIRDKVFCAELDFDMLVRQGDREKTYRPMPRYPAVTRDFSFYVDDSIPGRRA